MEVSAARSSRVPQISELEADFESSQRQTVVSQFYQLDRLVVEGGKTVCSLLLFIVAAVSFEHN